MTPAPRRLGVVADVHANLPALEVALDALAGVDALVCAGDLVGYGPHPNECVARLREAGALCVAGNHDLVAVGAPGLDRCDALAAQALRWTRGALSDDARAFLTALPGELTVAHDVLVAHGAPGDPWHYVREPADAAAQLARVEASVLVVGHTHRAMAVSADARAHATDGELALTGGTRWLLNPGSVGQSRERRRRVRFLELDLDTRTARFHALPYDAERTLADLRRAGIPAEAIHRQPRPWRWLPARG